MIATGVPANLLPDIWADLWPILERAYRRSDEHPDILAGIRRKDLQLWAVYEKNLPIAGICTKLLRDTTSGELDCHLWLVAGSHLSLWAPDFLSKLTSWAKTEGCTGVTGNGRRGWDRIVRRYNGYRIADRDGLPCWRLDL